MSLKMVRLDTPNSSASSRDVKCALVCTLTRSSRSLAVRDTLPRFLEMGDVSCHHSTIGSVWMHVRDAQRSGHVGAVEDGRSDGRGHGEVALALPRARAPFETHFGAHMAMIDDPDGNTLLLTAG